MDESSLKHFIEYLADVKETLSCRHRLGMARPHTRLISHQEANHNPSQHNLPIKHHKHTKT